MPTRVDALLAPRALSVLAAETQEILVPPQPGLLAVGELDHVDGALFDSLREGEVAAGRIPADRCDDVLTLVE